jgi:hypothetical protein
MNTPKSLKYLLAAATGLDKSNSEKAIQDQSFTFTCDDNIAEDISIDATIDIVPVNEENLDDMYIEASLDYLFVSSPVEQPFTFLKPPQPNISPTILSFSWRDRNNYLSTKMVNEFFSNCTQFFLCRTNNFISKGIKKNRIRKFINITSIQEYGLFSSRITNILLL